MSLRGALNYAGTLGYTGAVSIYAVGRQLVRPSRTQFQLDTRRWARGVARGVGIEVRSFGFDVDPEGTYVLMANHQSHADIVALICGLPVVPGFLAKSELRRVPFFGRAMEVGGHVFIDRGRHERAVEAIEAAARGMRAGDPILIFPEGTRSRRREVMPFKKGGFHLAMIAGAPIVPIGLRGTADVLPKHDKSMIGGVCEVHVGEPIETAGREIEPLVDEVRSRICELAALPAAPDRSGA